MSCSKLFLLLRIALLSSIHWFGRVSAKQPYLQFAVNVNRDGQLSGAWLLPSVRKITSARSSFSCGCSTSSLAFVNASRVTKKSVKRIITTPAHVFVPDPHRVGRKQSSSTVVDMSSKHILDSPASERNKEPIWNVLKSKVFPFIPSTTTGSSSGHDDDGDNDGATLRVLEIATGAGVHTYYFATQLLALERDGDRGNTATLKQHKFRWYPADMDEGYRASTLGYIQSHSMLPNVVEAPIPLTLNENGIVETETIQKLSSLLFDTILNINMIHISPWEATIGLMKVARDKLQKGGYLVLYGPYRVNGTCVESNRNFDASLRQRNPEWGVRDLESVIDTAQQIGGLTFVETVPMPANNLIVLFTK